MNTLLKPLSLALAVSVFAPTLALAENYDRILADDSAIAFTYSQMGVDLQGSFGSFDGSLAFDPQQPEAASATIEVALESISTGLAEADVEAAKPTWFNIESFPVARFESQAVRVLDDGRYEITGTLSIKGHIEQVVFPASFSATDGIGRFEGDLTIRRGDFSIGEGSWSRSNILANEVTVRFSIVAASN